VILIWATENIEVYNILCDSVGLKSKSNNGTLHLPLHPVGLHDEQNPGPETPPDPVTTATKTLGVDPVTHSLLPPSGTTGTAQSTSPLPTPDGELHDAPGSEGEHDDDDENEEPDKTEKGPGGLWNWLTDTVEDWWRKITGHGGS
jgi:hypothetical protein